jgi:hypothetical protein
MCRLSLYYSSVNTGRHDSTTPQRRQTAFFILCETGTSLSLYQCSSKAYSGRKRAMRRHGQTSHFLVSEVSFNDYLHLGGQSVGRADDVAVFEPTVTHYRVRSKMTRRDLTFINRTRCHHTEAFPVCSHRCTRLQIRVRKWIINSNPPCCPCIFSRLIIIPSCRRIASYPSYR